MDRDTHTQNACLHQRAHLCALAEGCVSGQRRPSLLPVAQWLILAADRHGWGGITCPLPLAQHRKGKWNTAHAQKLPEGLCVSMGRGGEQVSCFLYCEIRSKNQAPADPQQRILKWGQSYFNGHRRVRFRYTKCEFSITSLGLFKPHVKWRFELNTFSVCHWLDTQIALPPNSYFCLWWQDTGENIFLWWILRFWAILFP